VIVLAPLPLPKRLLPAETLLFQAGALRFGTDVSGASGGSSMRLADRCGRPTISATVSTSFIAMRRNVFSNELCCKRRIRVAARPLRIHVDQTHVIGRRKGTVDVPAAGMALVSEPGPPQPPSRTSSGSQASGSARSRKPNVLNPIDS